MYSKIINPKTGRKVSVKSRLGKKILQNYLNNSDGGGIFTKLKIGHKSLDLAGTELGKPVIDQIIADYKNVVTQKIKERAITYKKLITGLLSSDDWYTCIGFCEVLLSSLMKFEFSHTGYYLNYLRECCFDRKAAAAAEAKGLTEEAVAKTKPKFTYEVTGITGHSGLAEKLLLWDFAKKHIRIKDFKSQDGTFDEKTNIAIVAGPSAAGKTFIWKKIFKHKLPESYPKNYLSIDGGDMREYSLVYQKIAEILKDNSKAKSKKYEDKIQSISNYDDFDDLLSTLANLEGGSGFKPINIYKVFQKFKLKSRFKEFLKKSLKRNGAPKVSLVIPDTLAGTIVESKACSVKTKKKKLSTALQHLERLELHGSEVSDLGNCIEENLIEKWNFYHTKEVENTSIFPPTILLIYQHVTPNYRIKNKCAGTEKSGKNRAKTEGKKYSSKAHGISMELGLKLMKSEAVKKSVRMIVHNGGKQGAVTTYLIIKPEEDSDIPDSWINKQKTSSDRSEVVQVITEIPHFNKVDKVLIDSDDSMLLEIE